MRLLVLLGCLMVWTSIAGAQTTQPVSSTVSPSLELRGTQAFNRGDFAVALPILQKLADQLKDQPSQADKLAMLQEQIRVCQKNQNTPVAAVTSVGDTSGPFGGAAAPTIPTGAERRPHTAPKSGEIQEMSIKELGNFEYDTEHPTPIPADVRGLNDTMVRLRGYMIPMDQAESISQFALVPSLFACCYGQPPQIQHTILVNCPKGKAVSYFPDEIVVEGKLKVGEKKEDGFIVGLFEVGATSVRPAPK